jgi:hypothetical protein
VGASTELEGRPYCFIDEFRCVDPKRAVRLLPLKENFDEDTPNSGRAAMIGGDIYMGVSKKDL